MKRVGAGAHFLTLWLFEPAKRPDDSADYRLEDVGLGFQTIGRVPIWRRELFLRGDARRIELSKIKFVFQ